MNIWDMLNAKCGDIVHWPTFFVFYVHLHSGDDD
jgi:hypothetical protein